MILVVIANNRPFDRSDDIRACLDKSVSEGELTEDEEASDIEVPDMPDDISLEDFSSGSGKE